MGKIKEFLQEKWLEILIVAIGFQLMTNAVCMILGKWPVSLLLIGIGLILFVLVVIAVYDKMKQKRSIAPDGDALKIERKGVIFTLGFRSHETNSPLMKAMRALSPEYFGFIGTKETFDAGVAKTIIDVLSLKEDRYKNVVVNPKVSGSFLSPIS